MIRSVRRGYTLSLASLLGVVTILAFQTPPEKDLHPCRCKAKQSPVYQAASTQRMAKRLKRLYQDLGIYRNFFMATPETADLEPMRGRDGEIDPVRREWELANVFLRAGQTEEAIQRFDKFKDFVARSRPLLHQDFVALVHRRLAISYLRLGEQNNCISRHTAESCLLPISQGGVHTVQHGSRAAIKEYLAYLAENPDDLGARWLLNIAYMTVGEYPDQVPEKWRIDPSVFESDYDIKHFRNVAPPLGLDVAELSGGSIVEDFDGDGYLDIMASSWGLTDQLRYFRNNGDNTFTDCTEPAGLKEVFSGLNLLHADYNNDSHPDVLVLRGAWWGSTGRVPNSLLRNNGDGTFDDVTEEAGLLSFHPSQTASWGDYNNDGWVDLFVGNESLAMSSDVQYKKDGEYPCELFHNNGDGTFTEVAAKSGVAFIGTMLKAAVWGDYDNDGLLDLYLSCLIGHNVLYRNDGPSPEGGWRFTDVTQQAGVAEPYNSFSAWFWDYDNDGWLDIFVSGYLGDVSTVAADYLGLEHKGEPPRLYRNNHQGSFTDVAKEVGLNKVLWTMGCNFGDLDNDGYLDFYVGTGDPSMESLVPNRMFRNAAGKFFQDVTTSGGFGHLQKGHGVSFGDIDNDGDQDIYSVIGGAFRGDIANNVLFENPGHGNHWITLKLEGVRSNRAAIGTRIKVSVDLKEGRRDIYTTVSTGGSFGASSLQQEIGLSQATSIHAIEITWPASRKTQVFKDVGMDQILRVIEDQPDLIPVKANPVSLSVQTVLPKHSEKTDRHHHH